MNHILFLFILISTFLVTTHTWAQNALENQDKSFQKAKADTQSEELNKLLKAVSNVDTTSAPEHLKLK